MSKYYLIKCNRLITSRPNTLKASNTCVELTEQELNYMKEDFSPEMADYNGKLESSIYDKIKKVLDNE